MMDSSKRQRSLLLQMVRWPVAGQLMPEDSRQWSFILNLTKKSNYIRFAKKSHIRYSIGKSRNS